MIHIDITFAERLITKTGTFQERRDKCAMFMLYESMAWTCMFRFRVCQYLAMEHCEYHASFLRYSEQSMNNKKPNNMKKIKLYIAVSLDGFIARPDGDLDWLLKYPMPTRTEYGYKDMMDSIDTIIMGNGTYQELISMNFDWAYKEKSTFVLTRYRNNLPPKENVTYLIDNVIEAIHQLKQKEGKDIWLIGGGQVITLLLNYDLVDEMQICYIPLILGEGIPLFPNKPKESKWELNNSTVYDSGILKADYYKMRLH